MRRRGRRWGRYDLPKNALTVEQQADQLIARGLVADRKELMGRLTVVNYYRFSATSTHSDCEMLTVSHGGVCNWYYVGNGLATLQF